MIARARPGSALVALVLSLAATAALLPVFDGRGWFSRSIGLAVLVTITGVAARAVTRRWWAVLAVQLLGLVVAWAWTTTGSLSPVAVAESVGGLIRDARHTLMTYAAPAPTTPGVVAGLCLVTGLITLLVDGLSVTCRMPAGSRLPPRSRTARAAPSGGRNSLYGRFEPTISSVSQPCISSWLAGVPRSPIDPVTHGSASGSTSLPSSAFTSALSTVRYSRVLASQKSR